MSKPISKNVDFNSNIWYETYDPDLVSISFKSRAVAGWVSRRPIMHKYSDSAIMPISNYVENIGIMPELVSIVNNEVTIRQLAYADIFLLENDEDGFYNVDRTWIRQYYQTKIDFPQQDNCFPGNYLFYSTWMPTFNTPINFVQSDAESPVHIFNKTEMWLAPPSDSEFINSPMVAFAFKREGPHMEDEEFGVIRRGMPLFDIKFQANDIMVEKIRKMYASN